MSSFTNSSNLPAEPAYPPDGNAYPQTWQPVPAVAAPAGESWARYLAAVRRYKWLILLVALLGSAVGLAATRFVTHTYEVRGSIWVADPVRGPVEPSREWRVSTWSKLATSQTLATSIVRRQRLFVSPAVPVDSAAFAGFEVGPGLRPGRYELRVDSAGARYTLLGAKDSIIETGTVGDSVGRTLGFRWQPAPAVLGRGRSLKFSAITPQMASASLVGRIKVTYPDQQGNTLELTMNGTDAQRTAATMNEYLRAFVVAANDLQRGQFNDAATTLAQQLDSSERQLRAAEEALQAFRERRGARPAPSLAGPSGIPVAESPTLAEYFKQQSELEQLRRERQAIEEAVRAPGELSLDALALIPTVKETQDLHETLHELSEKQTALRQARRVYTDSAAPVRKLVQDVDALRTQTIPPLARAVADQLARRERELTAQIGRQTQALAQMPSIGTNEMRLVRDLAAKNDLYQRVRSGYDQMRLAALSTPSQVRILDTAIAPLAPTSDGTSKLVLMAILGSLAAGVGLALLLDRTDRRFRYPEQATGELGLPILGVVPSIGGTNGGGDPEEAAQVVEAFRTIRMNLRYAFDGNGDAVMVTVSSPGPGDGKSLVSANLALSFAQAGHRVLLIDGDIRRGELHEMFDVARRPGLIDHLAGAAPLEVVLRETSHENLTLVPCGTRRHRGPELLQSEALNVLVDSLRTRYEVIITDSAPLSAGIDAFALGAATGSMLVVLRSGETDRRMAQARLQLLHTLPIRVLGAVVNDIRTDGAYRYYAYQYGYSLDDDESGVPQLTAKSSATDD